MIEKLLIKIRELLCKHEYNYKSIYDDKYVYCKRCGKEKSLDD